MGEALRRYEKEAPEAGTLVAGKYRVRRVIGRGGMGRVLAATNEATGKSVALKWILDESSPRASSRFAREARAAGRIHHPNVIDVYDVVEHEGSTVIVMEELHGETLAARLAREGRFAVDAALALAIEIGRGVEAAHAAGVIHRDLKPANVFLCDGAEQGVKILDFGISKITEAQPADLTDTGVVLGTPQYLAPEQVRSASDVDHRVDVYALGAILYEMLGGRPPHQHAHVPALLVEIATVAPRPIGLLRPDLSSSLSELVGRALAKDPDARFPSAGALVAALRVELGTASSAPPEGRSSPALEVPTLDPVSPDAGAPIARDEPHTPTAETRDERPPAPSPALAGASPPAPEARAGEPSRARSALLAAVMIAILGVALSAWWWSSSAPAPSSEPLRDGAALPVEPMAASVDATPTAPAGPAPSDRPAEVSVAGASEPPLPTTTTTTAARPRPIPRSSAVPTERRMPVSSTAPEAAIPPPTDPPAAVSDLPPEVEPAPTTTPRAGRLGLDDL